MSIAGNWNFTMRTPLGSEKAFVVFSTDGESLSGRIDSSTGIDEFTGGTISGNNARWSVKISKPMTMTLKFDAVVEGDKITGKVAFGTFASGSISGQRA